MSLIFLILGLAFLLLAHPRLRLAIIGRLFNEGLITPQQRSPKKSELIRFAGPNISLFGLGMIFLLLSMIIHKFGT